MKFKRKKKCLLKSTGFLIQNTAIISVTSFHSHVPDFSMCRDARKDRVFLSLVTKCPVDTGKVNIEQRLETVLHHNLRENL